MLEISTERLTEMYHILSKMNNRNKQSSDGLGLYIGDGLPSPYPTMRSEEILSLVNKELAERCK